ncbi:hypothetical protein ACFOOP_03180 [Marinicaulis aureus]|uniref:Lipoprotein n=1 Tax=Hyphococcus aureus TaxID=2666033 RepID=A0ABW1KTJ0_9PROT
MLKKSILICAVLSLAACATISPRSRIENRLVDIGLSERKAECMAHELDERLDRDDLNDVADFLGDVNEASSDGENYDALLNIDNARAAAAIAAAGLSCAFGN